MTDDLPPRVSYDRARQKVEEALAIARDAGPLSGDWAESVRRIGRSPSKTYVAALGCALLAKATDPSLDAFCMQAGAGKSTDGFFPYSVRGFAKILVEHAATEGVHLGRTGREPLQNRPFSVVARLDAKAPVAVRARSHYLTLLEVLGRVQHLDDRDATIALATFFRERLSVGDTQREAIALKSGRLSLPDLAQELRTFLTSDAESGRRGQAFVAACLDLVFDTVETQRVNDPSRKYPGDIRARNSDSELISLAEVRQKTVVRSDVLLFAQEIADAGYPRAFVFALHPGQGREELAAAAKEALDRYGVMIEVIDGISAALHAALSWSGQSQAHNLDRFPQMMLSRLRELDVGREGLESWIAAFDEMLW